MAEKIKVYVAIATEWEAYKLKFGKKYEKYEEEIR